jgi:lipopolysaccharide export LptBFGC system permease protein LptF
MQGVFHSTNLTAMLLGVVGYFSPTQWMVIGLLVSMFLAIISAIISNYLRISAHRAYLEYIRGKSKSLSDEEETPGKIQ